MGLLIHHHDRFDQLTHRDFRLRRPATVRGLVRRHPQLRPLTTIGPDGRRVFERPTMLLVNGRPIMRAQWRRTMIGERDVLSVVALPPRDAVFPQGLGGGGGSNPLPIVLALAVAVAAPYVGLPLAAGLEAVGIGASLASTLGTSIAGLGLGLAAYGLMSLFSSPPPASQSTPLIGNAREASPTYNLQAQGNVARLGQPIPELFGKHLIFPDFATAPYQTTSGSPGDLYLHHLMVIGVGEYAFHEIKIGDSPIESYDADVDYEIVEPGALGDTSIADPRWIASQDIGDIELLDSSAGSPWFGPFPIMTGAAEIDRIQIDTYTPRGLWDFNASTSSYNSLQLTFEVEAQEIDASGVATGAWTNIATLTKEAASPDVFRFTDSITLPSAGRWQIRIRRTDTESTANVQHGHQINWIGLRGYLTTERRFDGVTLLAVRMRASGTLSGVQSRRINVLVTRKLPVRSGGEWQAAEATQNPVWAFAQIARSTNGAGLDDDEFDLDALDDAAAEMETAGWTFDYVFDQSTDCREAMRKVARAVIGEMVEQGGKARLVLDRAVETPVMMVGPRNALQGTFDAGYKTTDRQSSDGITGTFINPLLGYKPDTVTVAFEDSAQERLTEMNIEGVTDREQVRAILWYMIRCDRYRRRTVRVAVESEGLLCLYGDGVSFSQDFPSWGQTAEIVEWDAGGRIATLTEQLEWGSEGETHYIALRDEKGRLAGPYVATQVDGEPYQVEVGTGTLPTIYTDGDNERTWIQFGPGTAYSKPMKVIGVTPQDFERAQLVLIDDDPRVYDEVPDEEDDDSGGAGDPQTALDLHITSNANNVNLRTVANAGGYSGLTTQAVSITIDAGVDVGSVVRGSWPTGYTGLTLVNRGRILGAGGGGGGWAVNPGSAGGPGLDTTTGALTLDNVGGVIYGGGGGGGAGGNSNSQLISIGGGGGGGGQGWNAAGGGAHYAPADHEGSDGDAGSSSAPGAGGAGGTDGTYDGGDAGSGGAWGAVGGDGGDGPADANGNPGTAGQAGGAAGAAILGSGNVTWTGVDTGELIGALLD